MTEKTKKVEDRHMQLFHMWLQTNYPWTEGCCFHVPNEQEHGDPVKIARMTGKGLLPGVPDYHIDIASSKYSSLKIEFKTEGRRERPSQVHVIDRMRKAGHRVEVCYSHEEAKELWLKYLADIPAERIESLRWEFKVY
jgi:hypothetical protein